MSQLSAAVSSPSSRSPALWQADLGDGTYRNPVLHADYSDPDAIRVGDDYWMISSSFSHVPGLPVLHSRDLVNWSLVGHALPRLVPEDVFATPQHGKGVWAPAIRHHGGRFWIYYPDPDFGIYLITADDPRGPWSSPILVRGGRGLIDPCPLWDADGSVYLIHGWARSRAGFCNVLTLLRLSADGTRVEDDFGVIIDGNAFPGCTTLEGPKFHRRNGWYYVFAPAGGVKDGWQSVFRSRTIRGPYEERIVLAQGRSPVNGPHQGALVDTPAGDEWFLHFQDKDAYGRIVHLQPVVWRDDWPVIGADPDHDGKGEPVLVHRKPLAAGLHASTPRSAAPSRSPSRPVVAPSAAAESATPAAFHVLREISRPSPTAVSAGKSAREPAQSLDEFHVIREKRPERVAHPTAPIPTSDEFDSPQLGLQWQWQANPQPAWYSLSARPGCLRLFAQSRGSENLFAAPHLLLQKFPAPAFAVTARLAFDPRVPRAHATGLVVFGSDYAWIGVREGRLVFECVENADATPRFTTTVGPEVGAGPILLRATVAEGALCEFAEAREGAAFQPLGEPFQARPCRWVGAKIGLFAVGRDASAGADFDWIRFESAAP